MIQKDGFYMVKGDRLIYGYFKTLKEAKECARNSWFVSNSYEVLTVYFVEWGGKSLPMPLYYSYAWSSRIKKIK